MVYHQEGGLEGTGYRSVRFSHRNTERGDGCSTCTDNGVEQIALFHSYSQSELIAIKTEFGFSYC